MKLEYVTDIEVFRPLGELWMQQHNGDEFGIDITVEDVMADAKEVLASGAGVVIGAKDDDEWVGFMLVFTTECFLGLQMIAVEKYWFAKPNALKAAPLMLIKARAWAREEGCSHLIMSASNLASNKHDKVCRFYERKGLRLFETSYICEV